MNFFSLSKKPLGGDAAKELAGEERRVWVFTPKISNFCAIGCLTDWLGRAQTCDRSL